MLFPKHPQETSNIELGREEDGSGKWYNEQNN